MNEKLEDKYDFKTLRKRKINLVYKFIFVYIMFLFALAITQMKLGYSDTVAFIIFAIFFFIMVGYFAREGYKIENIIALKLLNNLELAEFMDFMHEQHKNKKLTIPACPVNFLK